MTALDKARDMIARNSVAELTLSEVREIAAPRIRLGVTFGEVGPMIGEGVRLVSSIRHERESLFFYAVEPEEARK